MIARLKVFAVLTSAALSAVVCSSAVAQAVVVGSKEFTEQLLVAEMTNRLLLAHGFTVHKGTGFATQALERSRRAESSISTGNTPVRL
jgi:osmoprotectant transport system substrate-binding protein